MSAHASLGAATQDRKARLAQLKSLKRKAPDVSDDASIPQETSSLPPNDENNDHEQVPSREDDPQSTARYLSGRNYDAATRGPKLGFETAPSAGVDTIEQQSAQIADEAAQQQKREREAQEAPLDLFKLQPKKPNWDLKRDLERKLEILNVRTDNAIARLVRERIEKAKEQERAHGNDEDALGMEGNTLVEATREMEREQQEEAKAEAEED